MRLPSGRRAARALRPRVMRVRAVLFKKNCASAMDAQLTWCHENFVRTIFAGFD